MKHDLSIAVLEAAEAKGIMIATAESCTGGLIAGALTDIAGSSAVIDRGFISYSNEAKSEMLGVPIRLISEHGAVSAPVAEAMALGARHRSRAGLTVAVTGIAGPGGGSIEKPVGLVYLGLSDTTKTSAHRHVFEDRGRDVIRDETVLQALRYLLSRLALI